MPDNTSGNGTGPAPRLISVKNHSRVTGTDALVVRLLGGVSRVTVHSPGTGGQVIPCEGAGCEYCRYQIAPSVVHLAPVVFLRPAGDGRDQWERAAFMLAAATAASIGEFTRGRVLRIRQASNRHVDVSPEREPAGAFDVPAFDVEASFRAVAKESQPTAKKVVQNVRFRPGQDVIVTGAYDATHGAAHGPVTKLVCVCGERFPSCAVCGERVQFRLVTEYAHASEHPLFSGAKERPSPARIEPPAEELDD